MSDRPDFAALVVFAKDPQPGQVKTRMSPALTPEVAAAFYREMLADVLAESERACETLSLAGTLTVSPKPALHRLAQLAPKSFSVVAQSGDGLGARMAYEVKRGFASGARCVILRGSDNPALGAEELAAVVRALDTHDVVASPDPDGGYGAIGLRVAAGEIFDHSMSTKEVLRDTLARAAEAGLTITTTNGSFDLDTVWDLARLHAVRESIPPTRCARTLAFADQHGLWQSAGL